MQAVVRRLASSRRAADGPRRGRAQRARHRRGGRAGAGAGAAGADAAPGRDGPPRRHADDGRPGGSPGRGAAPGGRDARDRRAQGGAHRDRGARRARVRQPDRMFGAGDGRQRRCSVRRHRRVPGGRQRSADGRPDRGVRARPRGRGAGVRAGRRRHGRRPSARGRGGDCAPACTRPGAASSGTRSCDRPGRREQADGARVVRHRPDVAGVLDADRDPASGHRRSVARAQPGAPPDLRLRSAAGRRQGERGPRVVRDRAATSSRAAAASASRASPSSRPCAAHAAAARTSVGSSRARISAASQRPPSGILRDRVTQPARARSAWHRRSGARRRRAPRPASRW